ncbi:zinc finger protein 23-like [Thalassophryne amazonica]|uniref:zinc finger protein 23-like n=1 Tax=Thalassophryne amazonica TaxID=390379 RepID=UPI001470BF96|nr:zinc finger protein 23-like [Thalassophryne amazonica]XP_034038589.1 zinc finger protein 23-like [Thalassophryne amazonica]XP_034038590.1 zinc finger protein 23-like [Thalassophryne amazonica]
MQQLLVSKEVLSEQQEWNQSLDHNGSEPSKIKEEQEEHWSEDEEKSQSSQFHQGILKTEGNAEGSGGSQPASNSDLQPDTDDMRQLLLIKEEILHEQQEWNLSVGQEDIKEEQEELWISQQGQQIHQLEEGDDMKFPFTAVFVKIENDEKPQSSQTYQNSNESIEYEPVASSSTVHRTLTTQADGEDSGGPQSASNSGPYRPLQPKTSGRSSDSSETETDDSCEWKQIRDFDSGFNSQTNNVKSGCNIMEKFNSSECGKAGCHTNYSKHTRMQASEKPFSCSECGKGFGQKGDLIRHMRIHTGEKPFGCSVCGRGFGLRDYLIRHMRMHTGEKPFACFVCDKRFSEKGHLNTHIRIHTGEKPFGCSVCGRGFGHKGDLMRHMRTHTGEKPFECSECGTKFGHKSHLMRHMRIHTGEKPFACSECDKRFGRKGHLVRHMRIHTG